VEDQLCQKCPLKSFREENDYHIVWGAGNPNADILIIGEAPGENEAKKGVPFIGKSGRFLRSKLSLYLNLESDAYITNTVLCRPPDNRRPAQDELECCFPHVLSVFHIVSPKLIITAGKVASQWLSDLTNTPFDIYEITAAQIEAKIFAWLPLYHPSYVMRSREQTQRFEDVLKSYRKLFKGVSDL
jgi:DNA polymerase